MQSLFDHLCESAVEARNLYLFCESRPRESDGGSVGENERKLVALLSSVLVCTQSIQAEYQRRHPHLQSPHVFVPSMPSLMMSPVMSQSNITLPALGPPTANADVFAPPLSMQIAQAADMLVSLAQHGASKASRFLMEFQLIAKVAIGGLG
jgi:hypothetical protein